MKIPKRLRNFFTRKLSEEKKKKFWRTFFDADRKEEKLKDYRLRIQRYERYLRRLEIYITVEMGKPKEEINWERIKLLLTYRQRWLEHIESVKEAMKLRKERSSWV